MKLMKDAAAALCVAIGWKAAGTWDGEKLKERMKKIPSTVDEDTELPDEEQSNLDLVLAALEAGEEVEVVEEEAEAPAKPAKKKPVEKAAESGEKPVKKAAKKAAPAEEEEEAPAKPAKKAKEPKPEKPKSTGVRKSKTRPYVGGSIIKKYGLDAGITEAMVAEVDSEFGEANPRETKFVLRNAWHAIRGYLGLATEETAKPKIATVEDTDEE